MYVDIDKESHTKYATRLYLHFLSKQNFHRMSQALLGFLHLKLWQNPNHLRIFHEYIELEEVLSD